MPQVKINLIEFGYNGLDRFIRVPHFIHNTRPDYVCFNVTVPEITGGRYPLNGGELQININTSTASDSLVYSSDKIGISEIDLDFILPLQGTVFTENNFSNTTLSIEISGHVTDTGNNIYYYDTDNYSASAINKVKVYQKDNYEDLLAVSAIICTYINNEWKYTIINETN